MASQNFVTRPGSQFFQSGTGAVERTVTSKLQDIVHVNDFGGNIKAAVDSLPSSGGVVLFSAGTYVSPYSSASPLTKNGITFQGAGMPAFNSGYTALENGTIIQGTLVFRADDCSFNDLGIDSGSAVCTALNGGSPLEGLVSGNATFDTYNHNNHIKNVSVLCKDASAPVHAILFESQEEGSITNVSTVYAAAGVVLKARQVNVDGVYARSHTNYSFLIKSDRPGGTCNEINVTNLLLETTKDPSGMIPGNGANWDTEGLWLQSNLTDGLDYEVTNINITNVVARNVKSGIRLYTATGSFIKNVNISNINIENCYYAGVRVDADCSLINIANGNIATTDYNFLNSGDNNVFQGLVSSFSQHHSFSSTGDNVVFTECTADTPYNSNYVGFDMTGSGTLRNANYRNIPGSKYSLGPSIVLEDVPALSTSNSAILEYLRDNLITSIENITGTNSVVAAWFGAPFESSSTTMKDYSKNGTRTATFRSNTFTAIPRLGSVLGLGSSTSFNAVLLWNAEDANAFSFGNGSTDSPFSVMTLVKPVATYQGQMVAKSDDTTGATAREYNFLWANTAGLYFYLVDDSTGGVLGRRQSGTMAGDAGAWHYYTGTYDGSRIATGIKVYRDGVETTNSNISSGSYTAMENTTSKVGCYAINSSGSIAQPMTMDMAVTIIWNVELSAANVPAIQTLLQTYFGV